jgi:hypothetical protein
MSAKAAGYAGYPGTCWITQLSTACVILERDAFADVLVIECSSADGSAVDGSVPRTVPGFTSPV